MKRLKKFQTFLPGLFLLGFNIGTGSVTAMAKAGATYHMSLLWAVFISCVITYFMIVSYGRFTAITGETALHAFRKYIHPGVGVFFIVALTVNVCGSVIGVMGIIADICHEWSKGFVSGGISPVYFALFFILIVYLIFWNGRTKFFQKALAVIVAVMALSFIINFFMLMPPPIELLKGMIPHFPEASADVSDGRFLVISSMV